jgi:hypothetical protein
MGVDNPDILRPHNNRCQFCLALRKIRRENNNLKRKQFLKLLVNPRPAAIRNRGEHDHYFPCSSITDRRDVV